MFDEEGRVCLEIKNSFYRALDNAGENETKELASYLYEDAWVSTAAADGKTDYEKVLLSGSNNCWKQKILNTLKPHGGTLMPD